MLFPKINFRSVTCGSTPIARNFTMWKYLKRISAENKPSTKDCLPQESGPLSRSIPSSAIASANKAVLKSMESATKQEGRGKYGKYSSKEGLR